MLGFAARVDAGARAALKPRLTNALPLHAQLQLRIAAGAERGFAHPSDAFTWWGAGAIAGAAMLGIDVEIHALTRALLTEGCRRAL